jgi:hypothetical protein
LKTDIEREKYGTHRERERTMEDTERVRESLKELLGLYHMIQLQVQEGCQKKEKVSTFVSWG